jgi:hypothetical protein
MEKTNFTHIGLLVVIAVVLIALVIAFLVGSHCSHGHHVGVCGREYRAYAGKVTYIATCRCQEDHY